mgnify:CR=1 FL=1
METVPAQRQAAILFADIAGSTRLYETLGDAEALATITRALDLIRQVCEEHGGRIVKTIGDEAMAIFPNAANAAYASITMQTQVSGMKTSRGAPLSIHAGFHYGPVIEESKDVFGDSVNLAARLTSLAKASQTLLSEDTLAILSPSLRSRTRPQDTHTVRGKQNDIAVFELIWQESREELTAMAPRAVLRDAAAALGTRYVPNLGMIRSWDFKPYACPVIIGTTAIRTALPIAPVTSMRMSQL